MHTVLEQVVTQARRDPNSIALQDGAESFTYGQLLRRAARLASWLRARGASCGSVVGICLPRGADLVVAELGVMLSGAAFVPLDHESPIERRRFILRDAGVRWLLTETNDDHLPAMITQAPMELFAAADGEVELEGVEVDVKQLAYVAYISGSTGQPKGVMVEHGALANFVDWHRGEFQLGTHSRTTLMYSPAFDSSAAEIWPALTAGATVCIPDAEIRLAPEKLQAWLLSERITFTDLPTPLVERLLALPWPKESALKVMLSGGDRLRSRPRPEIPWRLFNEYGPTEATVTATSGWVEPLSSCTGESEATASSSLPDVPAIGRPIAGNIAYVLDAELGRVPAGVDGELYLGGAGLARGYLGRTDLTADRFVPDPFSTAPGARLYRTGDRVKWRDDGTLHFIGRVDEQLKLRGFRIEPGEIVAALRSHQQIAAAHVSLHTPAAPQTDDGFLVAYVVPRDPRRVPDSQELRAHLAARVPGYMVPRTFVVMDQLPLNTNGKVDTHALPAALVERGKHERYVAPRTDVERELASIWEAVLRLERVGLEDDFFELGGHSLVAVQIRLQIEERFGVDVSLRDLFLYPQLARLAAVVETAQARAALPGAKPVRAPLPPLTRNASRTRAPLTLQQQQVWFFQKLAPTIISYQAQTTIVVSGSIDFAVLERALTEITRRHEILRTTYEEVDGEPWQVVCPVEAVTVPIVDLSGETKVEQERRRDEIVANELRRSLSLLELPLVRRTALRFAPDQHELILVEHHAVHDGESFGLLMQELEVIYNAYARGEPSPLAELPVQYADFATWQRRSLDSPAFAEQLAYWQRQLSGAPQASALPTDKRRPALQTFNGDLIRIELPPAMPSALRAFSQHEGVTVFNILFSAFATLLQRFSGEDDLCIGSALAGRGVRHTERLIGMFVNMVVLRCGLGDDPTFRALVRRMSNVIADAAANDVFPFPKLVEALQIERDPSRNPLTQVMFSFHDSVVPNPRLGEAHTTVFEQGNGSSKMDLDVVVIPHSQRHFGDAERGDDRITILWEYNRDLFERSTMERMAEQFLRLVEAAIAAPDTRLSRLPLLGDRERRRLTADVSSGTPPGLPVHETVVAQARHTPHAIALEEGTTQFRYAELVERAAQVAAWLRARSVSNAFVAICLPRGFELVATELGVLLAGAAFMPLDPDTPSERLALIVDDAGARAIVTTRALESRLPSAIERLYVDHLPRERVEVPDLPRTGPGDLAYVMYTSGSTGRPKGVMVEHGALTNFAGWHCSEFGLTTNSRTTLMYSPAFDSSAAEIWPALSAGATLCVPDPEIRLVPERLRTWLLHERISFTDLPTPIVERLIEMEWPADSPLRTVLAGGDRLHTRPRASVPWRLYNQYGPTEGTVTATSALVEASGESTTAPAPPPIGRPIAEASAYVLDRELQPVPVGVDGELYLGGAGLARGYVGRSDLTAERFVPHPFARKPGARLYRTGDQVRWRNDGTLHFVGRVDDQVKLRGFRIELGEIAAQLRRQPGIADAFVTAMGEGEEARLVAYLVLHGGVVAAESDWREALGRMLPQYMIPSTYVVLDELPLTPRGKIDVRALPVPTRRLGGGTRVPPGSELQARLAKIWCDVLQLDEVGMTDNFFDLGGNSLLLGRVHHMILTETGREFPMIAHFAHPTIESLARYLEQADEVKVTAPATELRQSERQGGQARLRQRRAQLLDKRPGER